jgi:hypothetical protein
MLRLLVLILLAYLVYRGIESVVGQLRGETGEGTFRPDPPPPTRVTVTVHRPPENTEELIACSRCGVRVPRSRAMVGEGGGVVCASCGKLPR